ncbi:redox-regulated ATPase YchF [Patescibacteria group bacterium]|nr:redox-regulated ATPase YchF [Patescibacteria group bacterium]
MSFSLGIVGLPNVGKSTLFNALLKNKQAEASNYPFCTIDPNVGIVEVPDQRLAKLAKIDSPEKIIPTAIEFYDIAGLVKGAHKGEGLGNQFLSHIREVKAIIHVVRIFEDKDITHVDGDIDPTRDVETIDLELILADLKMAETTFRKAQKEARSGDKEWGLKRDLLAKIVENLEKSVPLREVTFDDEEQAFLKEYIFLTIKPVLYVLNVSEDQLKEEIDFPFKPAVKISAKMETDLNDFSDEEVADYLAEYNLEEPGLERLVKESYSLLNLITFLTSGPKESRAWTVRNSAKAPEAAGVIHSDFADKFIRAEVISYEDYIKYQGESGAKENGLMRVEGKDYEMQDGDVVHFRVGN